MQRSLEQRFAIKFWVKLGKTTVETVTMIKTAYKEHAVRSASVLVAQGLFGRPGRGRRQRPRRTAIHDHHGWQCDTSQGTDELRPMIKCSFNGRHVKHSENSNSWNRYKRYRHAEGVRKNGSKSAHWRAKVTLRAKKTLTCANVIKNFWTTSVQVTRRVYLNMTRRPKGNHRSGTRTRPLAKRNPGWANQRSRSCSSLFFTSTGSSQVCRTWNHSELQILCGSP